MTHQRTRLLKFAAVIVAVGIAAPTLYARFNPKPASPNFFSLDQEVQMGQQEAAKIDKQMPIVNDAVLNRYIQNLGARLVAKAPGPKYPYTFKIVNQKEINAFALPGGPIHINLGTIQAADNEAQLAGVMAHEMGHVIMRHSTNMMSKQALAQAPLAILGGLMGNGKGAQIAQMVGSVGLGSVFLKYSRDAENQADLVGTGIMHDAGYNPQAMVDFFHKLEEEGGARGPQFMSDHPNPGNRAQSVANEMRTLTPMSYQQDSAEFRQIKARVGGMKALTAQEIQNQQQGQGAVSGSGNQRISRGADIIPSGQFQTFNHSNYSVAYPSNWQVFGDANSEVTIAPKSGIAGDAIAYGAIISGFDPESRGGSNSLDDATHQLLDQLRQSNPDLRAVGSDQNITVNGRQGKSVMLVGPSPLKDQSNKPERERDWLVATQRQDGSVIYFVFIAPDQDFAQLQPSFEKMLRSLKTQ
jgi:Zn-dependent protease with chaperone function